MSEAIAIPSDDYPISGRLSLASSPIALVVLSHGAGAGMDHMFMGTLANQLCSADISVLRFNFPYIYQGRRAPDSPKKAQKTINEVVRFASNTYPDLPLFV